MDPIDEQRAYYRARAPEYDQAFERRGRYDRGSEANAKWFAGLDEIRDELTAFRPFGDVLEIACGTGNWTSQLAQHATRVVAMDGSPEMLRIAKAKTSEKNVEWLEANVFGFQLPRRFDVVFFGFWISHVPASRFGSFWETVRIALKPDGRVFFFDTMPNAMGGAVGQQPPRTGTDDEQRELDDGRSFTIVKRYFTPESIATEMSAVGFTCEARAVDDHFLICKSKPHSS
ncbi:MAG: class I SAM-dependent methyltransferase [Pirellulaceae bacterium]|jgi:demethylmenaquinone methyltransferase/2-methoxy-6-polyprenyl-1,4-benzoquinol methylase|nr:class I SAM-dependent methyltransferase [Pirellulaceae bacterium]MDP7017859.1 class I SAM-dependent methyltransferase [Pirellulaceae bacterium]